MELKLAVNNDSIKLVAQLEECIKEKFPLITLEWFNEDIYKQKQNAYKLKGGYGAKQVPFAVLYNEKKPIKAFYSEVNECTFDDILNCLTNFVVY